MSIESLVIRPLSLNDVHNICELHSSILPLNYPSSYFRQCLLHPHRRICMVAHPSTSPQSLVAFISASITNSPTIHNNSCDLHIISLGVIPTYRRNGLARRLIESVIDTVRQDIECGRNLHREMRPRNIKLIAYASVSNTQAFEFYKNALGLQPDLAIVEGLYRKSTAMSKDAYKFVGYVH